MRQYFEGLWFRNRSVEGSMSVCSHNGLVGTILSQKLSTISFCTSIERSLLRLPEKEMELSKIQKLAKRDMEKASKKKGAKKRRE